MKELSLWMSKVNHTFWLKVSKSTNSTVKSVCVYRIIAGLSLLSINYQSFSWIGYSPQAFFKPPVLSIANFFQGFPPVEFFIFTELLLLLLVVFITVGIKARISLLLYIIISLLVLSFKFSFGKIDHGILLYAMLFCMSFSGWGSQLALVPDKITSIDSTAKSLSLLSVLICFAFFSAGFQKAFHWINFNVNTSGTAKWFYDGYYVQERQYLLAPFFKHLPFLGFKMMDFLAVPFELSPLFFLLASKKAWRIWLLIASTFHFSNALVLNIDFVFIAFVDLAFVDFTVLFSKIQSLLNTRFIKPVIFFTLSIVVVFRIKLCLNSTSFLKTFFNGSSDKVELYIAVIIWLSVIIILFMNAFRKKAYQKL